MAHYAWSPIRYGGTVEGGSLQSVDEVKIGDSVDAGKLGISDDEFQYLIDSGAVREDKPPETAEFQSQQDALLAKASAEFDLAQAQAQLDQAKEAVKEDKAGARKESGASKSE